MTIKLKLKLLFLFFSLFFFKNQKLKIKRPKYIFEEKGIFEIELKVLKHLGEGNKI